MTLKEMRQPVPGNKERNFLHLLTEAGHFDIVQAALRRDPATRMAAEDFLKPNCYGRRLLDILQQHSLLWDIFTPGIWQGRLGEMTEVWKGVRFPSEKERERFAEARRAIIDYQHHQLKAKRPKDILKKGPQP